MFDIGVYAYQQTLFLWNSEEFGEMGILGQAPSTMPLSVIVAESNDLKTSMELR